MDIFVVFLFIINSLWCFENISPPYIEELGQSAWYQNEQIDSDQYADLPEALIAPGRFLHISAEGRFLYWEAREEGLALGKIKPSQKSLDNEVLQQDYAFKPGFNLSLMFQLSRSNWDTTFSYTQFDSMIHTKIQGKNTEVILSPFFDPIIELERLESDWTLKLTLLDTELGKTCFLGEHFFYRPFIGLRFYLLNQKLFLDGYPFPVGLFMNPALASVTFYSQTANHWSRSHSLGPRVGTDLDFLLGYGLQAHCNVASSIVYFNYDASAQRSIDLEEDIETKITINNDAFLRALSEISTGLSFGGHLFHEQLYVDVGIFFDAKVFSGHNPFSDLLRNLSNQINGYYGNLYFWGLSCALRSEF
ncbi:MAG: Lpg1974 family pore-forming outer membrane protein [Chlamydiota bacterium]